MAYQYKAITYGSGDGNTAISAHLFMPEDTPLRGIVQISHGFCDYVTRYAPLAEALTAAGFALCGNDALGHGKTAHHSDELGFFAAEDGADTVVTDLHKMTLLLRSKYKGTPIILLGVGLGTYPARMYAQSYYRDIDGLLLVNAGSLRHPSLSKLIARTVLRKYGEKHKSRFLENCTFGLANLRVDWKDLHGRDWLNRDGEEVGDVVVDPLCNFRLTASAYYDLYCMADRARASAFVKNFSKSMPVLFLSGDGDPLSHRGRDAAAIAARLRTAGARDVTEKVYAGARHDLLRETCRAEVYADIVAWLTEKF